MGLHAVFAHTVQHIQPFSFSAFSVLPNFDNGNFPACAREFPALAVTEAEIKAVKVPVTMIVGDRDPCRRKAAEIGFQLAGMSATQARELCQTIDWKSTLVLPIPRFVGSYSLVEVNGAQGTLIKGSGRRAPDYVLIWVKNGIIYCLAGQGDSSKAVTLANSLD